MPAFIRSRTSSIALAAAGLLLAVAHAAQAAGSDAGTARVDVVGQRSLHDACPAVDPRDLADQLAPAWDDATKPSSVEVDFRQQGQHVYDVRPATDSPRVLHQIRRVVHGLHCDGGDDQAHAVRFVVRFVAPDGGSRLAAVTVDDVGAAGGR
jgi:hypothetical protein